MVNGSAALRTRALRILRIALAVAVGLAAWLLAATLGNRLLRAGLSGYAEVELSWRFTRAMLLARLAVGASSSLIAGLACALAARPVAIAVPLCAGVLLLSFLPGHYLLWSKFPVWYHAVFLLTLVPLVLLGAALGRRLASAEGGAS